MKIRSDRNLLKPILLSSLAMSVLVSCSWFGTQESPTPQTNNVPDNPSPTVAKPTPSTLPSSGQPPKPTSSTQTAPKDQIQQSPQQTAAQEKALVSKVQEEVNKKGSIAKQDVGQTYLGNILQSQQATQLVKGRFTPNMQELNLNLPTETDEYRLQILEANDQRAIVVAIAKQSGIFSYTGAVYARTAKTPVATICKSNNPSRTPPTTPKLVKAGIVCPSGSTAVD